ncbi:thiol-disulfide oxidoreductase [Legionella quinlivanii]|uniref:Thiol-disulfide oxidoreductase n=1 Tax=Legionella quinlivanii TaxID=45073 RepID=A0A0W0Y569_9GAMM|nr:MULTISPECIES: TlpA disulfide reductase family protein [Legionella]MCE3046357.1 TlpA family protein disulfide reductase [Legionella sp. 16cNR16C]KTD51946.1 thiol-disulfide oxidoreductase [Legionella quinlivanii]MCW8452206.1 TlpA family protein disulfide reductase [Legionella quinlivanii]SEF85549.1 Thiol-disulfide isomerase or thioredoxin [Legionella quinlivanii DSM 21216]STY09591.1 thiol-disulfide oxidoreductase [Legionella quinlivanii]
MTVAKLIIALLFTSVFSLAQATVLTDTEGKQIDLSSLRGKWVLINYWASWCQPCLNEIHELNSFYKNNKEKIALFAVNYDELPLREQRRLIKQHGITYPCLAVDPGHSLNFEQPRAVPATFVLNPQGKLVKILYGEQTRDSLNEAIG